METERLDFADEERILCFLEEAGKAGPRRLVALLWPEAFFRRYHCRVLRAQLARLAREAQSPIEEKRSLLGSCYLLSSWGRERVRCIRYGRRVAAMEKTATGLREPRQARAA
jgi:hypothetical protein